MSRQTDGHIQLWTAAPYDIDIGDTFKCEPGCNKLFHQTCVPKYSNGPNHRGFKDMVGTDAVVKSPDSTL